MMLQMAGFSFIMANYHTYIDIGIYIYISHIFITNSSIHGQLDCFQVLAFVNNTAIAALFIISKRGNNPNV